MVASFLRNSCPNLRFSWRYHIRGRLLVWCEVRVVQFFSDYGSVPMNQSDKQKDFVRRLVAAQPRVFAYICTLVPDSNVAEDLLQETCAALWDRFDQFDPDSSFVRWAIGFAHVEVLSYRRDRARERVVFSDQLVEKLAPEAAGECEDLDELKEILQDCLGKMTGPQRELLLQRYQADTTVRSLAEEAGRPVQTLYSQLKRLRIKLFQCVRASLAEEGRQ